MSLLHQNDRDDYDQQDNEQTPEREVTLSTAALLGIFAGLVLLCGLFFALGYAVRGRQTPRLAVAPITSDASPRTTTNFNTFKPAAGSPAAGAAPAPAAPAKVETPEPDAPAEAAPVVRSQPAAPATAAPAAVPTGSFVVQVAAMSHAEDAAFVVAALKAKGYPAAARTEPQDKLLHIQVGPYASHKDADAIKLKLVADGYDNPIVK